MKKSRGKVLVISAAAVVSAAVLTATAFAAAANVSGYEALKQSGFALADASGNVTVNISAELIADGEKALAINLYDQANTAQGAAYSRGESFVAGGGSEWYEEYYNHGVSYMVYSNNPDYYSQHNALPSNGIFFFDRNSSTLTENQKKLAGILMDLFTGDVKNYFVTDGNTISVSLTRNQIPEVIQSLMTVGAEATVKDRSNNPSTYHGNSTDDEINSIIQKYLYNPVIDSCSMTAVLSPDGYLMDIDARGDFSGKDANGTPHSATLYVKASFKDYGATQVKPFDPQGRKAANVFVADGDYDQLQTQGGQITIDIVPSPEPALEQPAALSETAGVSYP